MTSIDYRNVAAALSRLGVYRVKRAQQVAAAGKPDGVSGSLILALGMRETWGRNIEGGATFIDGKWVALDSSRPDEAKLMDVGWLQINRHYHHDNLKAMPAVAAGTWKPVVAGHTPADAGYVPRFEESLQFTMAEFRSSIAYGGAHGVHADDLPRFAVAAHNAGVAGALAGYRAGDVDARTALGDYSLWVLGCRKIINTWLGEHDNWRWAP